MIYIPREYFPAVMFARKMIRGGTPPPLAFHKAGQYYGLATSDVASWFGKMRGSAPAKAPHAPKRFYWWFVTSETDADTTQDIVESGIEHTSNFNAWRRKKSDTLGRINRRNDYGGNYAPVLLLHHCTHAYESGEAADAALKEAKHEHNKRWGIE